MDKRIIGIVCGTRPEIIKPGRRLPRAVVREATRLLADQSAADAMRKVANPFGDGHASRRITEAVLARLAVPAAAALDAG